MPKMYFAKTVRYLGERYTPNTVFEVRDEDVSDLRASGGWLVEEPSPVRLVPEEAIVEEAIVEEAPVEELEVEAEPEAEVEVVLMEEAPAPVVKKPSKKSNKGA